VNDETTLRTYGSKSDAVVAPERPDTVTSFRELR
jgi:hypothetical protein